MSVVLAGTWWAGGTAEPVPDAVVLVGPSGRVERAGPAAAVEVPDGVRRIGGPGCWVGPGVVDAHVHLAFGTPDAMRAGGVVAMRDLGAPPARATEWRAQPGVTVAGPILTAPGGYPSQSWGAAGFTVAVAAPEQARAVVAALDADLVKVAFEPAGGAPVPPPEVARAVVAAAHERGLPVTAHALTAAMVERALDAGVDELCHVPVEVLPDPLVQRIAAAGLPVVSTLQTFFSDGTGAGAAANAAALHAAGVPLVYGTDLGNAGTRPGVDPRELDRLAAAGLGRLGALRAATRPVAIGDPAALVVLAGDPLAEPAVWRRPLAVVLGPVVTTCGPIT